MKDYDKYIVNMNTVNGGQDFKDFVAFYLKNF